MTPTKPSLLQQILWPPKSPVALQDATKAHQDLWWKVLCCLTVIPLTAILHHVVFYRPTCMLKYFGADYYVPSVLFGWLTKDPSFGGAVFLAIVIFFVGKRFPSTKILVAPIFVSFLPLSVWIWDVPFTNRFICENFHDDKLVFPGDVPIKSRYFYLLGFALYFGFVVYLTEMRSVRRARPVELLREAKK